MKMEINEIEIEKIKELSQSIKNVGLINPISVKRISDDEFELVCGERRLKAHELNNKKTIQAIVKDYSSKKKEMEESLIENLHRVDLSSVERENFIYKLWKSKNYKYKRDLAKLIGVSDNIIQVNIIAKEIRKEINASPNISTRSLKDVSRVEHEDRKKIIRKLERKEINSEDVVKISMVIKKCPVDVKQAYYKNKITIEQAGKISKIKDKGIRKKMILAHKNIKAIDRSIERNFRKIKIKENHTIKIKEMIQNFRANSIENQKTLQNTIQSLMKCLPYVSLMDDKQLKKLNYFQELFGTNLENAKLLLEKFQVEILKQE